MLNLVYHALKEPTVDEKVTDKLSACMKDRFDMFGTLPDMVEDDWIEDEERLRSAARLKEFTIKKARAHAFDIRYADDVDPKSERWDSASACLPDTMWWTGCLSPNDAGEGGPRNYPRFIMSGDGTRSTLDLRIPS